MNTPPITPQGAKQLARQVLDDLLDTTASDFESGATVLETLRRFPWTRFCALDQQPTQEELLTLNEQLDLRSCFGRAVACFALASSFHGDVSGAHWREVRVDWFRANLMDQWKKRYQHTDPSPSWVEEFLMYEEPHAVYEVAGYQFDSASMLLPRHMQEDVMHGLHHIGHKPWNAVAACLLVNRALAQTDPHAAIALLEEAEEHTPGLVIIQQTFVRPLAILGRFDEAAQVIVNLYEDGWRSARMFFALEAIKPGRGNELANEFYGERLWKLLSERIEIEVVCE